MRGFLQRFRSSEPQHLKTGIWGERVAERFLKKRGYKILARRVRIGKHDELDLVARKKNTLIFIEVKTRAPGHWGRPADAVNRGKRRRMTRASAAYLARLKTSPEVVQYDIVEVIGTPELKEAPRVNHIEDAFASEGGVHLQW
jgi:putative endonuclease